MLGLSSLLKNRSLLMASLFIVAFSFALAQPSFAKIQKSKKLTKEQKLFLKAEKAFKTGKLTEFRQLKAQLKHYPLVSYLEFAELSKQLLPKNKKQIDAFLKLHKHSPLAWRLEARYMRNLLAKKHYGLFSQYFAPKYKTSKNTAYKCRYLEHQLKAGVDKTYIWSETEKLWNVGKSQSNTCNPLFAKWQKAGKMTKKVIQSRLNKATTKGALGTIKYLLKKQPKKKRYLSKMWTQVKKNPGVISKINFFPQKELEEEAKIAVYGIKKLAWGNRDGAYKTWQRVKRHAKLPKNVLDDGERTLFLALATENNPHALPWAKRNLNKYFKDPLVTQWKLATFLRNNQWQLIQEQYHVLDESIKNTNQWKYWHAIAIKKLGVNANDIANADIALNELAKERDYYGFKAARQLKKPLQLNHKSLPITAKTLVRVKGLANVERAKELIALGRFKDANREWGSLAKRLKTKEEIRAAAKIAHDWGWYNQGIFTIAKAKEWNDTDLRFPTAFKHDYAVMGKKVGLPPEWLMAVTRQESAYNPYAVSPAKAYGLMQVLPSTAKIYSKKFGIKYRGKQDLFNADTNIEMGSQYLKLRFDELDNSPIYASAAYNAGKHRITQWKKFGRFPTEIWIESIPYTETRDYIKKVMTYRAIYALKLKRKDTVFDYILNTETGG